MGSRHKGRNQRRLEIETITHDHEASMGSGHKGRNQGWTKVPGEDREA